jgi:hypothetical protein
VIFASPVSQPLSLAQAAQLWTWIAPSTPPPPSRVLLAALTMASMESALMSPSMISMRSLIQAIRAGTASQDQVRRSGNARSTPKWRCAVSESME